MTISKVDDKVTTRALTRFIARWKASIVEAPLSKVELEIQRQTNLKLISDKQQTSKDLSKAYKLERRKQQILSKFRLPKPSENVTLTTVNNSSDMGHLSYTQGLSIPPSISMRDIDFLTKHIG